MKFEAKYLSPVEFHALTCAEVSVSIQCFDWSKMAAEVFPVARIDEYAKPCEPAIHVLRSVIPPSCHYPIEWLNFKVYLKDFIKRKIN